MLLRRRRSGLARGRWLLLLLLLVVEEVDRPWPGGGAFWMNGGERPKQAEPLQRVEEWQMGCSSSHPFRSGPWRRMRRS